MAKLIVTEEKPDVNRNVGYECHHGLTAAIQAILGADTEVIYDTGIDRHADLIRGGDVAGVLVPQGHGDINYRGNLGKRFEGPDSIPVPILEAYRFFNGRTYEKQRRGYDPTAHAEKGNKPVNEIINDWLRDEVKKG